MVMLKQKQHSPYRILKAEHTEGQCLLLEFADGKKGIVDMSEVFGGDPLFEDLNDIEEFRSFEIVGHTIAWGDRDICNYWLYELATGIAPGHCVP